MLRWQPVEYNLTDLLSREVDLQDWHHLVPLWRAELCYEVWELDLRRFQSKQCQFDFASLSFVVLDVLPIFTLLTSLKWKFTASNIISSPWNMYFTFAFYQVDLQLKSESGGDVSTFVLNGEWHLLGETPDFLNFFSTNKLCSVYYVQPIFVFSGVPSTRNKVFYECCPAPYLDITFTIRQIRSF